MEPMTCFETIQAYGLRSLGIGERLLPRSDFTLCQHFTLIGSGMIWNIYFGVLALLFGFFLANALALAKASRSPWTRKPAEWFIFVFRGSPLFIQFFLAYEMLVLLPKAGINVMGITIETAWTTRAWAGALFVLFLNTAAYSAEIFYGALKSVPKGDVEAADCLWPYGVVAVPAHPVAHDAAAGMACLHERGDLSVSRHDAGLLFGLSGVSAEGRRALLRQLFCRQDLQSLHPLSHRGVLFHHPHAAADLGVQSHQPLSEPSFAFKYDGQNPLACAGDPIVTLI